MVPESRTKKELSWAGFWVGTFTLFVTLCLVGSFQIAQAQRGPDPTISKTGQSSVERGNSVVYTLTVWNRGSVSVSGATVMDILPSGFQNLEWACVASGTAQCSAGAANTVGVPASPTTFSLTTGTLPVNTATTLPTTGSYLTIYLRTAVNKTSTATSLTNTATVAAPSGTTDTNTANNSSSVTTTVTNPSAVSACQTAGGTLGSGNLFSFGDSGTFGERAAGDNPWGSPAAGPYGGEFTDTSVYAYDQTNGAVAQKRYSIASASGSIIGEAGFWSGAHRNILDYDNPGIGRFLYVDANDVRGPFFRQQITGLTPNTNYQVSFVMLNANTPANNSNDPIVAVQLDGVEYYTTGTVVETTNPTWKPISVIFNTGSKTSVQLELVNDQPTVNGNDLALDSIKLSACLGLPTGSVSGAVYSDDDRGNDLDAGEPKVAGVPVNLMQGSTVVSTTTTDAAGNYAFSNIGLGTYSVQLGTLPAGYVAGTTNPLSVSLTLAAPNATGQNFGLDNDPPTTVDRTSASMPNSSGDTLLSPVLSGADTNGGSVTGFRVTTLPTAAMGVLRWDDDGSAITPPVAVMLSTVIPLVRAGSLYFDPAPTFVGSATFQYAAIDNTNLQDATPATYTIPVAGTPDLTLSKSHTGSFTVGQTGTYSFTVNNTGGVASSGTITVTDTLPTGLTFVVGSTTGTGWSCSASGQTVTCASNAAITAAGSSTFSFNVSVGVGTAAGTNSITNTASVSGGGDSNMTNNAASDPTTVLSPNLTITKSHTPSTFVRGSTGTYTVTVTNAAGATAATSGTLTVTDTLPTGLTFVAGSTTGTGWSCTASGQTVTCTNATATLGAGASSAFSFSVNIAVSTADSVTNTAVVSGGNEATSLNGNNTATDPTPTAGTPDLTLTKTHSGTFTRGTTGTYTLTVGNSGNFATSGTLTLTDTLPTGLSVNGGAAGSVAVGGANSANWSCSSNAASPQIVTCTSTTAIAVGGSSVFTLPVNVSLTAPASVVNSATVSGGGEATVNNGNNSASDTTSTIGAADLSLTKSHAGSFTVGGTGTYSFTVTNSGESSSAGTITVTDTLPAGLTYAGGVSGTGWSCSASGQTVTCTSSAVISSTAGSNTSPFSFNVNVGVGTALPSVTNTASIVGGGDVTRAMSNGDVTTILSANLTVSKMHTPATFVRGGTGTYTITVGNTGTAPTSGTITVTDTLPVGLSVNGGNAGSVAAGGTNGVSWSCTSNAASPQVVTCTSTSDTAIDNPGSSVFTLTVAVGANAALPSVTNNVTVANPNEATANTGNNTASDVTPTARAADLTLSKTTSDTFIRGSTATYTLTVSNTGGTASSGTITVSDTLTSGLSYNGAVGRDWSCSASGQTVTCITTASIAAGSSAPPITLTVALATGAPNPVSNTATVSGGGEIDGSNNSSTVTTPTLDAGLLALVKTVRNITEGTGAGASNSGEPGDVLEYCVAYSNSGQSPVSSVLLTDAIPLDTTEETAVSTPAEDNYGGAAILWDITTPDAPLQYLTAAPDTDAGELGAAGLTVRVGGVPAGGAGRVCFRVSID